MKESKQTKDQQADLVKNSWISLKEAQASAGKLTQKYQLIERIAVILLAVVSNPLSSIAQSIHLDTSDAL